MAQIIWCQSSARGMSTVQRQYQERAPGRRLCCFLQVSRYDSGDWPCLISSLMRSIRRPVASDVLCDDLSKYGPDQSRLIRRGHASGRCNVFFGTSNALISLPVYH